MNFAGRKREKKKRGITLNVTLCLFISARKEFIWFTS
jgi:hypothetical protein